MKELRLSSPIILQKSVLTCRKAELAFFVCFSIWVFFHKYSRFTGQQGKGEAIYLYPFYHFNPFHRHLDISRVIAVENVEDCYGFCNSHYSSSYIKISTR